MTSWEYDMDREPTYQEFKAWLYDHLGCVTNIESTPQPRSYRKSCGVFDKYLEDFETDFEEQQKIKEVKKHCREILDSEEYCDFDIIFDTIYNELNKIR